MAYARVNPDVPKELFVPSLEDRDIASFPRIIWPGIEVSQGIIILALAGAAYLLIGRLKGK